GRRCSRECIGTSCASEAINTSTETVGSTYALTTSVDSLTGTTGADTFTATSSAASPTLNLGDTVDGGAGTDTLRIISSLGGAIPSITTTGVEVYEISSQSTGDTFAVNGGTTGLQTIRVKDGGGATNTLGLTNVGA